MTSLAAYIEERVAEMFEGERERAWMRSVMETLGFTTGTEIERLSLREVRLEVPFSVGDHPSLPLEMSVSANDPRSQGGDWVLCTSYAPVLSLLSVPVLSS